jgi:hydroxyacylglutathione hydrolase
MFMPQTESQRIVSPAVGLQVTPVPAFADNYIWLIHPPTQPHKVVAVDPGDAQAVLGTLEDAQLQLAGMLITHHHADHVDGVLELLNHYDVPVFGPATETLPGHPQRISEGHTVTLTELGLEFEVLELPGHTAGHIAYLGHGSLFCGDTLFSAGCGRLFEGTPAQMSASLSRLSALPTDTQVYCTHEYTISNLCFALTVEPRNQATQQYFRHAQTLRSQGQPTLPSNIGTELQINPFLRLDQPNVKAAATTHAGKTVDHAVDVFTVLRQWKDHFTPSPAQMSAGQWITD